MHNGRPHLERIQARRRRLPLRPSRHQGAELLRRGRDQARLLSGDGGADQSRERRQARGGVRPHAAHRRRCVREEQKIREVVRRAHNDYTEWSGPQRVHDILPDEADELLKRRFAIIQVWRPIRYPVETHPLAIADARSVSSDDFVLSERRYPNRDRPDLRHRLQSEAQVVLVAAPGARRGAGVQGLRLGEGRPRPLDRPHRVRRSDHAAERAAAREHRNPHAGVFLTSTIAAVCR